MDEGALQAITDLAIKAHEPDSAGGPAPLGRRRRTVAAFALPVALQAIANCAAAAPVGPAGRNWAEWIEWMVIGTSAQLMLLATWMLLGVWPLPRQCTIAGAGLALLFATQWIAFYFPSPSIQFEVSLTFTYAELGVFASLAGVAWYFRRVRAWRIAPVGWLRPIPPGNPLRFSLRQMFIATAVIGVFLAIRTDRFPVQAMIGGMIYGIVGAVLFVPTMLLVLGTDRRRMATLVDAVLLLSAAGLAAYYTLRSGRLGPLWVWFSMLAGSLVWLRICGIRLVHGRSARELRDQQSA